MVAIVLLAIALGIGVPCAHAADEPVMVHETFPSQAAVAFQKQAGPIPQGIVTRPVEPERFREVTP